MADQRNLIETISDEHRAELRPAEGLRAELNRLADELCSVIDGDGELLLRSLIDDTLVQKLCISINFLLDTVRRSVEQAEAKTHELEHNLATIAGQAAQIQSMSTPLLRVRQDVLVLPIVGLLDERRCEQIREALLTEIAARKARFALLDITGVALVDTYTAAFIVRLGNTVGLLGARCVLTGVSPAVARTLVELGIELPRLLVARDLEQGLAICSLPP